MSKTFDQGCAEVARLSKYFATNRAGFLAPGMKEAHVRQNLIDPLFEAIGWDVRNTEFVAPQYREVVPEDSLDDEGQQKAPDYAFRVGESLKFFAEAKKCGVNIHTDPAPAYQLRRYGWSAKIALSILTDFEELGVYDCTLRPKPSDKASRGRILHFGFKEYPDRWREIWDIFSREAVWSGAFDEFAASKRKRGTSEVDVEFLKEIEGWRESLARNLALRNPAISTEDLNAAVQLTIDRVIFLRMAEDRRLEPDGQLLKLCERENIYARFMRDVCRKADEKYNSGLFHFQKEPGVADSPDTITPKLSLDDKVLKPILQSLYFAHGSPYHFGVMPVEILGTVYERFLGKVIRLTTAHQAKVEEKPEVRKAGGVYYTPKYIVDYIVAQTIGKPIEGKSPSQLAKQSFRVLDMACGSGSFLLGAYQVLLDHCLQWYIANKPESQKKTVFQDGKGIWRLTIGEKKRILIAHIFGVDIDRQAVEVSKLSLLLKVLESENDQTMAQQMSLFHERALPNLSDNIKCGNSLIGPDYFNGHLLPDEEEELKRVNPFDWKQEFPDAMQAGGFDCVIGNPPYIRIQTLQETSAGQVAYLKETFRAANSGNYDIYVVFVEKGLSLLRNAGGMGFILPNKFFRTEYGLGLRNLLFTKHAVSQVVDFGAEQVFDATTYTCLLFLSNAPNTTFRFGKSMANPIALHGVRFAEMGAESLQTAAWTFSNGPESALLEKLRAGAIRLLDLPAEMSRGSSSGDDGVFMLPADDAQVEAGILRNPVFASDFGRYRFSLENQWKIIFPYKLVNDSYRLLTESELKSNYPKAHQYLSENQAALKKRKQYKAWYGYSAPRNLELHDHAQIIVPLLADRGLFTLIPEGAGRSLCPMASGGFTITISPDSPISSEYVLGLLNSKLLYWCLLQTSNIFRGGWITCTKQYFGELPIRVIHFSNKADKSRHDRMVKLVESMIAMHKQIAAAKSEGQKGILQRQMDANDRAIDALVYDLYGLTDAEMAIVEGRVGK